MRRGIKLLPKQRKVISKVIIIVLLLSILSPCLVQTSKATDGPQQKWIKTYDGTGNDEAYAVATDSNNNVIVTGFSEINGNIKCYTIKYDTYGTEIFHSISNKPNICKAYDVAVDSQNNIIISGCCYNTNGHYDYYIAKYDSNGNEQWNKTYDSGGQDTAYGIAVDSNDNVVVTGQASSNYYTIKYNKYGIEIWNKTYATFHEDCAKSVTIDLFDNIIVTGYVFTSNSRDWHTIKYDPDGVELWNRTYSNGNYNSANGVTVDSENNVIVVGTVYTGSNSNIYVIKYDENGNEQWHKTYDNGVSDYGSDVAINSANDIFVIGSCFQTNQNLNYVLIKYDSSGNYIWSTFFDGTWEDDCGTGVAVDNLNRIIVTGYSKYDSQQYNYITIKYGEKPTPSFTYQPSQPTDLDLIQFTDTTMDPAGEIIAWSWNFGDGATSTLQNPTHQYANNGAYTVTLTITLNGGSTASKSKQVQVSNVPPTADFTWAHVGNPSNNQIQFTDQSNDLDGTIVSYLWDFGDGETGTGSTAIHAYATQNTYNVKLTVTDDDGSAKDITKIITFGDTSKPEITDNSPISATTGDSYTFNATVTDNVQVGNVYVEYWYGAGSHTNVSMNNIASSWKQTITVANTLDLLHYIISASDTSDNWNATVTKNVLIQDNDKPTISNVHANPNPQEIGGYVDITCDVADNIGTGEVWANITYPDNTHHNFSLTPGIHYSLHKTYSPLGVYTYVIWANDTSGNTNFASGFSFEISSTLPLPPPPPPPVTPPPSGYVPTGADGDTNLPPEAIAKGPYCGFVNISLTFDGSASKDSDGNITNYLWSFGDTTTATGKITTHNYTKTGNYTITLAVTDNGGKTDTDTTYALIIKATNNPPTKPEFKNYTTNGHQNIKYNYTAVSTDENAISYTFYWDDNTNNTITGFLPNGTACSLNHTWTSAGIYNIWVEAADNQGKTSEKTYLTVLIDVIYVKDQGYLIDSNGDGIYDLFHSNETGNESAVQQISDGRYLLDIDGDNSPDHIFDPKTKELITYTPAPKPGNTSETKNWYILLWPILLIFVIIVLLLVAKRRKEKPVKEPFVSSTTNINLDNATIKEVEAFIDSLPFDSKQIKAEGNKPNSKPRYKRNPETDLA